MYNVLNDNERAQRFEWDEDGAVSFANYKQDEGVRTITHVETPLSARGKGAAARLMAAIVEDARARNYKIIGRCSYAVAYLQRNRDTADVQA